MARVCAIRPPDIFGLANSVFYLHSAVMIILRNLEHDTPELSHSRLLLAMQRTFQYIEEHGGIGLTKSKAFNRKFAHWAAEHFNWPGYSLSELLRMNKVLNEDGLVAV